MLAGVGFGADRGLQGTQVDDRAFGLRYDLLRDHDNALAVPGDILS